MKNYEVYFEIYGKKMKTTVLAESKQLAKVEVLNKLVFKKIEEKQGDTFNECINIIQDMNDFLSGKKS